MVGLVGGRIYFHESESVRAALDGCDGNEYPLKVEGFLPV